MNDRKNIVNQIADHAGVDMEHAERIFDVLRADDRIYWAGDYEGLKLRDDVDLVAIAAATVKKMNHPNRSKIQAVQIPGKGE